MIIVVVFLGAAIGSVLRYLLTENIHIFTNNYKIGATFLINILGSLLLGVLCRYYANDSIVYLLLGTGFCGGFTTFSTFNSEMMGLMYDQKYSWLLIYGLGSYLIGMLFGIVGYLI